MPKEPKTNFGTATTGSAVNLEKPACPLCGSAERRTLYKLDPPYTVTRCANCGMAYLYPRLGEAAMREVYRQASYYERGGVGYSDSSYHAQASALRVTFQRFLGNLARRHLTGGHLLEVGCGYGYLLDEARSFFDERTATEFSIEGAAAGRATGAEVFLGGIEEVPADRKFDCVIATQVIEHVYEPRRLVKEMAQRVKPGGHIVLATPDIGGVLSRCMGRRWPSLKAPEHVLYFDFTRLKSLLEEAGLREVRKLPYPHAFPLGLVAAKFRIALPGPLARLHAWVPATTVAAYGTVVDV